MKILELTSVAEDAIRIEFEPSDIQDFNQQIIIWKDVLTKKLSPIVTDVVMGYRTLTVYFNPLQISHTKVTKKINDAINKSSTYKTPSRLVKIPVCYDVEYGIDIEEVAAYHKLSLDNIIEKHSNSTYFVNFLGFSPGFPFLSGMSKHLATPRMETPRRKVPAGSVAIAGDQTGIYPSSSPGGWNIIGRTNVELLTLTKKEPSLLLPGDHLQFYPISKEDFDRRKSKVEVISK